MKAYYCECCGKILENKDAKTVSLINRETKKKEFDVTLCEEDCTRVRKLQFSPVKSIRRRKLPVWYSVQVYQRAPRRTETIYLIPDESVYRIAKFKTPLDKLQLKNADGSFYYTVREVKHDMETDNKLLLDYMVLLYHYQTSEERAKRKTISDNSVGFNQPDANFLSGMSRLYMDKGIFRLTSKQIAKIRELMPKYAGQITQILNLKRGS